MIGRLFLGIATIAWENREFRKSQQHVLNQYDSGATNRAAFGAQRSAVPLA
jgi:hypothetical protein